MSTVRVGRNELHQLATRLSERDWAITRFVERHRFASTTQLRRVFFTDHATTSAATRACVRVLDRLLTLRIITRLERRIGGNRQGSSAFVWCLDSIGDRLTRDEERSRRRFHEPSHLFLAHTLAIAETHVRLREVAATGAFRLTIAQIETEAWQPYVSPSGAATVLKPDLMVTISSDSYDDHWYIEIDLGTESLPVLLRKSRAYEEYRRTGRAQAEHGVFPRVLWVLPAQARVARLEAAIAAEPGLPDRLFVCTTNEALVDVVHNPPT